MKLKIIKDGLLSDFDMILDVLESDGIVLFENQASSFDIFYKKFDDFQQERFGGEIRYIYAFTETPYTNYYFYYDFDLFSHTSAKSLIKKYNPKPIT